MESDSSCDELQLKSIISSFSSDDNLLHVEGLLRRAAENYFDQTSLIEEARELTYGELYHRSLQLSQALLARGVKARDRILIFCENSIEFYVFYFAAWQSGAIVVPINTFLGHSEISYIIDDCKPKLILCSEKLKTKLKKIREENSENLFPDLICELAIDWEGLVPSCIKSFPSLDGVEKLLADECCLVLYTSGTTGKPKGVMLSSRNILTNAAQVLTKIGKYGCNKERYFAVLPLFHVFAQNACIWIPMITGSSVVVVPRIERGAIRRGLEKRPTVFLGFPALYGLLCLMRNAPLNSVKVFISGADALPNKIRCAFGMIYGRYICSGYGLTEASPVIAMDVGDLTSSAEDVGEILPGIKFKISDSNGQEVQNGEIGSLWIKGDNVMLGYYNAVEATRKILKNGWLDTGDLVSMEKENVLTICGREKDLIIHKGLNIYPQEIEQVLLSHPLVFRAAVIGKYDEAYGQIPVAYVVLKGAIGKAKNSLKRFCSGRLAAYKVPRKIMYVDDLPLNSTGKVDKKRLGNNRSLI
jgi:long-chain acyl-CoA synthetase